ncbi:MAG: ribosomal protein [Acidobacteria bacterium]|jgi:small subunit ribosomal protein S6|nr:ribosomal protein [Acidobacteriota bacterium]
MCFSPPGFNKKPLLAAIFNILRLESQKEDKKLANRTYEVMYIADPETADDVVGKVNETVTTLVQNEGGTIVRTDDIGRRRLAYPINKKKEGYYVLFEIEGSGQEIAEIERRMRVNDAILRYMTVRVDEDRKAADKKRNKRENKASKRASFRNKPSNDQNEADTASNAQ